ncbi:MAG TPA: ATP synthase subunit I [Terriglobia bacterium]|nr:ATP synthase subunit I [Terriglobia bacterium]
MISAQFDMVSWPWFITVFAALIAGVALGLLHFSALWWNCRSFAEGRIGFALLVQLARFAILILAFVGLVKLGAGPLLAAALGLLLARGAVRRRVERQADRAGQAPAGREIAS